MTVTDKVWPGLTTEPLAGDEICSAGFWGAAKTLAAIRTANAVLASILPNVLVVDVDSFSLVIGLLR